MTDADLDAIRALLQAELADVRADMRTLRDDIAPMRARLDGLPIINQAVTVLQRDVRALRDDMTVLTAIVMRLDNSHANLLIELHAVHTQLVNIGTRMRALEAPPMVEP
jgi:hypothetical protein